MSLLVGTSVWSLALRRDRPQETPEVAELPRALAGGDLIVTTGSALQIRHSAYRHLRADLLAALPAGDGLCDPEAGASARTYYFGGGFATSQPLTLIRCSGAALLDRLRTGLAQAPELPLADQALPSRC